MLQGQPRIEFVPNPLYWNFLTQYLISFNSYFSSKTIATLELTNCTIPQIDGVLGSNTEPVIEHTVIPLDKSSCKTTIGSPDIGKTVIMAKAEL